MQKTLHFLNLVYNLSDETNRRCIMKVNAINSVYYQPKVKRTLKKDNTVTVQESVNFEGKMTKIGAGVFGIMGGVLGFLVGGPAGAVIGAGIGAGTGAGYGGIDDDNQATGDDVNPLEGWERDTKF